MGEFIFVPEEDSSFLSTDEVDEFVSFVIKDELKDFDFETFTFV